MGFFKKVFDWLASGEIPNCPSCDGRGTSPDYGYEDLVWWKGKQEYVCGHCKGTGKI